MCFLFCRKPWQGEGEREIESWRRTKREIKKEETETLVTMIYFCFSWCQVLFCFKKAHCHRINSKHLMLCRKMSPCTHCVSCKDCGLLENINLKMSLRCLETHWLGLRLGWIITHTFLLKFIMHGAVEIPWLNGSAVSQSDCWNGTSVSDE